jgi:hypothetical protein
VSISPNATQLQSLLTSLSTSNAIKSIGGLSLRLLSIVQTGNIALNPDDEATVLGVCPEYTDDSTEFEMKKLLAKFSIKPTFLHTSQRKLKLNCHRTFLPC